MLICRIVFRLASQQRIFNMYHYVLTAGVTILLSLTIFLNTVSAIIPITSDSPLVGRSPVIGSSFGA